MPAVIRAMNVEPELGFELQQIAHHLERVSINDRAKEASGVTGALSLSLQMGG